MEHLSICHDVMMMMMLHSGSRLLMSNLVDACARFVDYLCVDGANCPVEVETISVQTQDSPDLTPKSLGFLRVRERGIAPVWGQKRPTD